jgi:hypothetical protein
MSSNGLPCVLYELILSYVDDWSLWKLNHPKRPFCIPIRVKYLLRWIPQIQITYEKNLRFIIPHRTHYRDEFDNRFYRDHKVYPRFGKTI